MTDTQNRREELLDRLADFVLAEGLAAASLRPLAEAAGTSDRMLLYYFKDKADVVGATLERISMRLVARLDEQAADTPLPFDELRSRLRVFAFDDALWPYMRLWLEVTALAARGEPLYRDVGERIGRGFFAWVMMQLHPTAPDRLETEAARLFAMMEGAVLLKGLGMDDVAKEAF